MCVIIHSLLHREKIYLLFICCFLPPLLYLLSSHSPLPTRHFHTHLTHHICSPAILAHHHVLIFSFFFFFLSHPSLLRSSVPRPPASLPFPSAANGATHLLCQKVWSQREPGDSEPAGHLPVWTVPPGDAGAQLILGEHVWWAGRRGQPVGHAAHILPLLLTPGPGQGHRLAAGKPQGSQLQVCFVNMHRFAYANTSLFLSTSTHTSSSLQHTCICRCISAWLCSQKPPTPMLAWETTTYIQIFCISVNTFSLPGITCHGNRITMNSSNQQLRILGNAFHFVTQYLTLSIYPWDNEAI